MDSSENFYESLEIMNISLEDNPAASSTLNEPNEAVEYVIVNNVTQAISSSVSAPAAASVTGKKKRKRKKHKRDHALHCHNLKPMGL